MRNSKKLYNLYIVSGKPIFASYYCTYIFYNFKNLIQINFNNNFNTSKVTNMSYMFNGCYKPQTELNTTNAGITEYANMLTGALSDANAHVILGYTTDTQSIATAMKNTCNNSSKITLKQIL